MEYIINTNDQTGLKFSFYALDQSGPFLNVTLSENFFREVSSSIQESSFQSLPMKQKLINETLTAYSKNYKDLGDSISMSKSFWSQNGFNPAILSEL